MSFSDLFTQRQSRSRPAARPAAAPTNQSRGAHTAAAPPAYANHSAAPPVPAQATATRQPGMIAQMAATAGSVAVGSTIGHGLSSMLFGGSRSAEVAPEAMAPAQATPVQQRAGASCDVQARGQSFSCAVCEELADALRRFHQMPGAH